MPRHKTLLRTLIPAGFLLLFATAAVATDAPLPDVETDSAPVEAVIEPTEETPATECVSESAGALLVETVLDRQTTPATQTCGACSEAQCVGAPRGQICNAGSGFGNCNIFSGGFLCPTGGWDCQCRFEPLP